MLNFCYYLNIRNTVLKTSVDFLVEKLNFLLNLEMKKHTG
jgi:hypothetical protein